MHYSVTSVNKMALRKEHLTLEIKQLEDNIKKKYHELKNNAFQTQRSLEKQYKPIIEPLKELSNKMVDAVVKTEPKEEEREDPPLQETLFKDENYEENFMDSREATDTEGEEEEEVVPQARTSFSGDSEFVSFIRINNIDELLESYLKFIYEDSQDEADFTYGIYYDGATWKMGSYEVRFYDNDVIIDGVRYKGTPGLFELIFKKHPSNTFTQNDLKTYKTMLMYTKAHVSEDGKIKSNRGYKYTNIISNMFPPRKRTKRLSLALEVLNKSIQDRDLRRKVAMPRVPPGFQEKRKKLGEGLMLKVNNAIVNYTHWDDPNELCDRLRLLVASKYAGNTNHDSEIVSILEELKEADIIKDFDRVNI